MRVWGQVSSAVPLFLYQLHLHLSNLARRDMPINTKPTGLSAGGFSLLGRLGRHSPVRLDALILPTCLPRLARIPEVSRFAHWKMLLQLGNGRLARYCSRETRA